MSVRRHGLELQAIGVVGDVFFGGAVGRAVEGEGDAANIGEGEDEVEGTGDVGPLLGSVSGLECVVGDLVDDGGVEQGDDGAAPLKIGGAEEGFDVDLVDPAFVKAVGGVFH